MAAEAASLLKVSSVSYERNVSRNLVAEQNETFLA